MTKREQLYPEIKRLREDEGLMWREIGERFGLSLQTVHDYYKYPTQEGDRLRRDRYRGVCKECGGPTNNGGAASGPPEFCKRCFQPEWTAEAILDAIRDFADDNGGVPPRVVDAVTGGKGHGRLPHENTVAKHFGSWNAGLLAAGFGLHCDRRPETTAAMIAAVKSGEPVQSIADRYGVVKEAVYMRLRNNGTPVSELRSAA